MNIFGWLDEALPELYESGHGRLAWILTELPTAAVAHRYDEADALAREGLGLARSLGARWIEVYLRHWHLQARHSRGEGEVALADAIAALDAAHQEETRGCPQAICTVQDVAICYARTDAVGWAPERLAVAEEALSSINPNWPCFACLTAERAAALTDLGRPAEAMAALDETHAAMDGRHSEEFTTIVSRLEALLALGRYDECTRAADNFVKADTDPDHEARRIEARTRSAYALASVSEHAVAARVLPPAETIARSDMRWWSRAARLLVAAGAMPNDPALGASLRRMVGALEELGSWRDGVEVALVHGELAVDRGRRFVAAEAARTARRLASHLREPGSVGGGLAALDEQVASLVADTDLPRAPEELLAAFDAEDERDPKAEHDPEADVDLLAAAHDRWPGHPAVGARFAAALLAAGNRTDAVDVLDGIVTRAPGEHEAARFLVELRLDENDEAEVTALAARLRASAPTLATWLLARHEYQRANWTECIARCRELLALE
ncbi:MAG: hypothetical protein M3Q48_01880, partial [Actinomycetota bacterium]|nr:hypothetical protein [Actinomycetota bacterium]